jgi:hypothetical protein
METKTIAHDSGIKDPAVVSREKWLSARTAFLVKDKEFTRLRDERPELGRRLQELGRTDASTQRLRGGEEPWSSLDGKVQITYRSRDARIGSKFSLEFSIAEVSHFGQPE